MASPPCGKSFAEANFQCSASSIVLGASAVAENEAPGAPMHNENRMIRRRKRLQVLLTKQTLRMDSCLRISPHCIVDLRRQIHNATSYQGRDARRISPLGHCSEPQHLTIETIGSKTFPRACSAHTGPEALVQLQCSYKL